MSHCCAPARQRRGVEPHAGRGRCSRATAAVHSGRCGQEHFPAEAVTQYPVRSNREQGTTGRTRAAMIPSDIYHQRASECLQLAEGSSDIAEMTRWRELALCWLRLSEYAEQFRPSDRPLRMA